MTKKIYIGKSNDRINQCLAEFVINKQLLILDKNKLYKYKKIY